MDELVRTGHQGIEGSGRRVTHLGLVGHQTLSNGIDLLSPGRLVRLLSSCSFAFPCPCRVVSCPSLPLVLFMLSTRRG